MSTTTWKRDPHGLRLRALRKERGWTQGDLARQFAMDVSATYRLAMISRWERGRAAPPLVALTGMAIALECTADYLLCRVDHPHSYVYELHKRKALDTPLEAEQTIDMLRREVKRLHVARESDKAPCDERYGCPLLEQLQPLLLSMDLVRKDLAALFPGPPEESKP